MPNFYLSFWDVTLANFPEGRFEKRRLNNNDAKLMIQRAIKNGKLVCVSEDDLLAPQNVHKKQKHENLRVVLQQNYDIVLLEQDFYHGFGDDDGGQSQSILPLQIAEIDAQHELLVITCGYQLVKDQNTDLGFDFSIATDSVEFHLFQAVSIAKR
jgi:hypothetical protein